MSETAMWFCHLCNTSKPLRVGERHVCTPLPAWSVRFKMEFGHHPIDPVDLVLTVSETDLEAVLRTLRRSHCQDIHMTKDQPIPQIPAPPHPFHDDRKAKRD